MNATNAPSMSTRQFCDSTWPSASRLPTPSGISGREYDSQRTTPLDGMLASQCMVKRFTGMPSVWGRRMNVAEG